MSWLAIESLVEICYSFKQFGLSAHIPIFQICLRYPTLLFSPMVQTSGGKQTRTIFKSQKILKSSTSEEPDLTTIKSSRSGLSFPVTIQLQDSNTDDMKDKTFLIQSNLPEFLPPNSPAARGRTLSQRPSLPPTFKSSDQYSVLYCVKVFWKMRGNTNQRKLRWVFLEHFSPSPTRSDSRLFSNLPEFGNLFLCFLSQPFQRPL